MAITREQHRIIGRALVASGALMFVLSAVFWGGLITIHPDARWLVTLALQIVGVLDVGIGILFLRRAKESRSGT